MYQWDATSLITCAKFQHSGRVVLDYALEAGQIVLAREIQEEVVGAGLAGGYPDAVVIQERIDAGHIAIRTAARLSTPFEAVLDLYRLQAGDQAVIRLALQSTDVVATVTDDRLLYVVLHRCGHQALFLPDFLEKAVAAGIWDVTTGRQLLPAVRSRLHEGFVEHYAAWKE